MQLRRARGRGCNPMAKLDLNRQPMPSQDPLERSKNFNEVALGYREEQALAEASRCLRCKNHPCMEGCPST